MMIPRDDWNDIDRAQVERIVAGVTEVAGLIGLTVRAAPTAESIRELPDGIALLDDPEYLPTSRLLWATEVMQAITAHIRIEGRSAVVPSGRA